MELYLWTIIIAMSCALIAIIEGAMVFSAQPRHIEHTLVFCLGLVIGGWFIAKSEIARAVSLEIAEIWTQISAIGILAYPIMVHIALIFSGRMYISKYKIAIGVNYLIAIVFIVISLAGFKFIGTPTQTPWGWLPIPDLDSLIVILYSVWVSTIFFGTLVLLVGFFKKAKNNRESKQVLLILLGVIIIPLYMTVLQSILFSLEIYIPLHDLIGFLVSFILLGIAISKFGFMRVTSESVLESAENLLFYKLGSQGPDLIHATSALDADIAHHCGVYGFTTIGQGRTYREGLFGPIPFGGDHKEQVALIYSKLVPDSRPFDDRLGMQNYLLTMLVLNDNVVGIVDRKVLEQKFSGPLNLLSDLATATLEDFSKVSSQILGTRL